MKTESRKSSKSRGSCRIAVYKPDGSVIHQTRRTYGGYSTRFRYDRALTRPETPNLIHGADAEPKFETIRGRLLLRDVTGDGKPDLVVPVNLQRVAYIENLGVADAEIAALAWDGSVLTEQWRSRQIGGVVTDYQFVDLDGDGQEELAAAVVESKFPVVQGRHDAPGCLPFEKMVESFERCRRF